VSPLQPTQAGDTKFYAVWDHWLLDTLASWQRPPEASYAISADDERGVSPPPTYHEHFAQQLAGMKRDHPADDLPTDGTSGVSGNAHVPPRKRKSPPESTMQHA